MSTTRPLILAPSWPYHPIENPAPLLGVYRVRGTLLSFSLKISRKPFNQTLLLSNQQQQGAFL
jgi:hypothetical protein